MIRPLFALLMLASAIPALAEEKPLTRIAFGSCADQDRPLPIFEKLADLKPELFIALGDNIYADLKPEKGVTEMESMKIKYQKLAAVPGWVKINKTCPIMATWDDHDYGKNDIGEEYKHKDESQTIFLDFFNVPKDDPRRTQKGVYHAKTFGPEGKRVQVILLDTRYFRSKLKKGTAPLPGMRGLPYVPNTDPGATFLGEEQWKWLEAQLKQPAEIRLLGSSVQVVSEDHPFEKWMNIPAEREKLFKVIRDANAGGVIVLSGDRHLAEISMLPKGIGYPLYDITSSGFNQGFQGWRAVEKNSHLVAAMPHGNNFGLVTIDWMATPSPRISLQVRDEEGEIAIKDTLPLHLLKPGPAVAELPVKPKEGAISPRDALKKKGEKVVVEMKVQATGSSKTRIFLNSEKNRSDELNFTIVLSTKALTGKYEKATKETFANKVIRVTGTVGEFNGTLQIVVDEEKQLEILE
ncbi:alkaline phosphatase D family protein [Zavarzinella formosa]|uniref:alkaline phosphatase D family protein n=1 Tax=Zavarzinella formosa TaxID=360055 RepID=UPI0003011A74|nr:alkaline phosphatase D family protein [Zavarzinella formosa]